jgi:phospholipid-binding lipoprotein MlaA
MSGCSTTVTYDNQSDKTVVYDPLESINRPIWKINRALDKAIAQPIAYAYLRFLPNPFQQGIGNFFDNFREITNIANDLLQFQFNYFWYDTARFTVNTTVGLLGFFNPAGALGLDKRKQDFGQTLYHWGYTESAYFVIPILGPSTIRDTIGIAVDYYALSAWPWIHRDWKKYGLLVLDGIDLRARYLGNETVIDAVALDEYTFVRDAYLQRRKYLVNNQNTEEDIDQDPYEKEFGSDDKAKDITLDDLGDASSAKKATKN